MQKTSGTDTRATTKPTTTGSDNSQNLWLNLLDAYNLNRGRDSLTDAQNQAAEALRPNTGMDFSPFMPLMDALGSQQYSREAALADTAGGINQIFRQYETQALPQIYKNPRSTGAYNDTSTQLLANDAYSTAVAKGQALQAENVMRYANARQSELTPLMQLMQGMVSNNNQLMSSNTSLQQMLSGQELNNAPGNIKLDEERRRQNLALLQQLYGLGSELYNNYNSNTAPANDGYPDDGGYNENQTYPSGPADDDYINGMY
jgi:hypothetical protein